MSMSMPFARFVRRPGRRRLASALVASAALATVAVAAADGASAASGFSAHLTPANTFFLQLDVSGGSTASGAPIIDWYSNGGANQQWTFVPSGGANTYELVNANSNQCLTTDGVPGHQVVQYPCHGSPGQLWVTSLTSQDRANAKNIFNSWSGLDLDVNGDNPWPGTAIDVWYPNGGYNQTFAVD